MKPSRLRALSGLMAALLIGPLAGSVHAQAPREIVIGVIYPMSGNLAQLGIDSVTAIRMATDIYNGRSELNLPSARKTTDGHARSQGRQDPPDRRRPPGQARAGPGRGRAADHPGEGHALLGCVHSSVTATASQVAERYGDPVHERRVVLARPDRARLQVVLPHLAPRRALQPGDVRLLSATSRRSAASSSRRSASPTRTRSSAPTAARCRTELAKKDGYEVVADMQYRARADRRSSRDPAPEGGQPRRLDADVLPHGRHPLRATEQGARLQPEDDHGPERRARGRPGLRPGRAGKDAEGTMSRGALQRWTWSTSGRLAVGSTRSTRSGQPGQPDLYDGPGPLRHRHSSTLLDAINRAGSTDPEAIRKALVATNIPGDQLIMTWDGRQVRRDGSEHRRQGASSCSSRSGKYYTIYPFDLGHAPTWSTRSRRGRTASSPPGRRRADRRAPPAGHRRRRAHGLRLRPDRRRSLAHLRADGDRQLRPRRVPDGRHVREPSSAWALGRLDPLVVAPRRRRLLGGARLARPITASSAGSSTPRCWPRSSPPSGSRCSCAAAAQFASGASTS